MKIARRSPEDRAAYIESKVPEVAKKFNVTEDEARELLNLGGGTGALEPDAQVGPGPVTPADSSVAFILERPDDETLRFLIQLDGGHEPEEMAWATHDEHGAAGIGLLADTVRASAEAIGARLVEQ